MYLDPSGQGWSIERRDGRVVLVRRFALTESPTMLVQVWSAPGLRDWIDENGKAYPISEARDGSLSIHGNVYRPIPLDRPRTEPLTQAEEPIKPPRGKWRWSCGAWQSTARR